MRKDDPRVVAVRDWYASVLPRFDEMEPGDLIASLRPLVLPVGWPMDAPPSAEEVTAHPARYRQDADGAWWVFGTWQQPQPGADPTMAVLSIGAGGASVQTSARATADREAALRLLPDGDDVAVQGVRAFATETFPTGRRAGRSDRTGRPWRSGHDTAVLARALFCAALRGSGASHREAARVWMRTEHDLHGPLDNVDAYEALASHRNRIWRTFEDDVCATNRRVLRELPESLRPAWA